MRTGAGVVTACRMANVLVNRVLEKLKKNELALSMTIRLVKGVEVASIARTAGMDSIYVDLEHGSFSLETTGQICMGCLAHGIAPFVRIPSADPSMAARVLDGGALGIIIPHVEDVATAEAMVACAKYPPIGSRSYSSTMPHLDFRPTPTREAMEGINAATAVVAMIESAKGIEIADALAAVPGIDMIHIGTNDLSNALGLDGQLEHPRIREAYRTVWDACRRHGKHLGIGGLATKPAFAAELIEMGARYLTTGSDLGFLLGAATERAKLFRKSA